MKYISNRSLNLINIFLHFFVFFFFNLIILTYRPTFRRIFFLSPKPYPNVEYRKVAHSLLQFSYLNRSDEPL